MGEREYWLAICQVPGLCEISGVLADRIGGAEALWLASEAELAAAGCPERRLERIREERKGVSSEKLLQDLGMFGARAVWIGDPEYPLQLRNISSPPKVLFVKGKSKIYGRRSIAVVGSRKATVYGKSVAECMGEELSSAGVSVVSGLARGIDAAAHRGALKGECETIAVLGCGIDVAYPRENAKLMREIAENGALVSEMPPGSPPLPRNFPARNRIIAGLSDGVVVIEAAEKSGALITADFALEQGRDVFALPGNVRSDLSRGAHSLIKQGAYLVEGARDILEHLGIDGGHDADPVETTESERRMLAAMGWEPVHTDEIAVTPREAGEIAASGAAGIAAALTILELKGLVRKEQGGRYIRLR